MDLLESGKLLVKSKIKNIPNSPGIYKFLDNKNKIIYIGKAKNLPKRLQNYTSSSGLAIRTQRLISSIKELEIITTSNESEALLLEANLIKKFKPRYNVLLKDDKSFPYIQIRMSDSWPQLTKFRGKHNDQDLYFGPFASVASANWTIKMLQKVFQIRVCDDHTFKNRTRPCMLYQIKRCSAPCTNEIEKINYKISVQNCIDFLNGKSRSIQQKFSKEMEVASKNLNFEKAAIFRDRIKSLTYIQSSQQINKDNFIDADVVVSYRSSNISCIVVFFYRSKQNWGNQCFFPKHDSENSESEVMDAFLAQFYENKIPPSQIVLNIKPKNLDLLQKALERKNKKKISFKIPKKKSELAIINMAVKNAKESLQRKIFDSDQNNNSLTLLGDKFSLGFAPTLIEVYDNSHTQGTNAIGSFVSFGKEGFLKNRYRKFDIKNKNINPGDDYGMMNEVIERRFSKLVKQSEGDNVPDLLLIDGGKGQYSVVRSKLDQLGFHQLPIIAIAKGKNRNDGNETFIYNNRIIKLEKNNPLLFFMQRLRDEAHRFAIFTHRKKRKKSFLVSPLDEIPGIGRSRKKTLLNHFGSAKTIEGASLEDLKKVDGISELIAKKIYNYFHLNKNFL
ncbi:excinuclease ABC subunit UvrC [Pelagibacteraceae bacterium]|nr:excinuclease ABC subunit UvrC [Pelagibacteraceae bacterium]